MDVQARLVINRLILCAYCEGARGRDESDFWAGYQKIERPLEGTWAGTGIKDEVSSDLVWMYRQITFLVEM